MKNFKLTIQGTGKTIFDSQAVACLDVPLFFYKKRHYEKIFNTAY